MPRRKGEITSAQIDRTYPHQVIVPANYLAGGRYHYVRFSNRPVGGKRFQAIYL